METRAEPSVVTSDPRQLAQAVTSENVDCILRDRASASFLAYYQKWLTGGVRHRMNAHFASLHRESDPEGFGPLDPYTDAERRAICRNLGAFQLTYGCNGACNFCGFGAIPGVRSHIPFPVVRRIIVTYGEALRSAGKPFFYWASDPFDYRSLDDGREVTYGDVHALVERELRYSPYVSTVVPKGSGDAVTKFIDLGGRIDRLSSHGNGRARDPIAPVIAYLAKEVLHVQIRNLDVHADPVRRLVAPSGDDQVGIGCFTGMLITPRGVYSVVQTNKYHPATPQIQFVVPFRGEQPDHTPREGDDVRTVLQQHIPLKWSLEVTESAQRTSRLFAICNPKATTKHPYLLVEFRGSQITYTHGLSEDGLRKQREWYEPCAMPSD